MQSHFLSQSNILYTPLLFAPPCWAPHLECLSLSRFRGGSALMAHKKRVLWKSQEPHAARHPSINIIGVVCTVNQREHGPTYLSDPPRGQRECMENSMHVGRDDWMVSGRGRRQSAIHPGKGCELINFPSLRREDPSWRRNAFGPSIQRVA